MTARKQLLLTPGPSAVPERVLEALKLPMIHHRTKDYQIVFERVNENLKKVFVTKEPVVTFASSGTGAMEASIVNLLSKGDKVIACFSGKFGERYRDIAQMHGLEVISIEKPNGQAIGAQEVGEALKKHPDAKAVLTTLLETSTGVLHPIEQVSKMTRQSQAILMVDAISGLTCDPLKMDEWGVDAVVCGSQKGLMLPPGLSFLAVGPRAQNMIETSTLPKYYFHLGAALKALKKNDTPYTPAVSLVRGLDAALEMISEEGLEAVWSRHQKIADWTRQKIKDAGLKIFSQAPSNALTVIEMPEKLKSGDVIQKMRDERSVIMADGQVELKGKIIRFAHMGDTAREACAQEGLAALADAMSSLGFSMTASSRIS